MSTGPSRRRVSCEDIQLVKSVIERCLQLYMDQKQVVETLMTEAKIEPGFTELVWKKLEEENEEFFKAYYLRLMLKDQILKFNNLLEQQVRLMHQIHSTCVTTANGPRIPLLAQNYPSEHAGSGLKPENMNHAVASSVSNTCNNGGSSLHTSLHSTVEMSASMSRIDPQQNMRSLQSSNVGLIQRGNDVVMNQGGGYSGSSSYMFGDGNFLETCHPVANASGASFLNVESTSQSLNEPLLDTDSSTFQILGST